MSGGKEKSPVIVKKIIKGGDGHHGGAWKVAYADFVTAMMAFFLLMWLLNATTEEQRRGIADYFDPKVPISRTSAGGMGMFGGDNVFAQQKLARNGLGGAGKKASAGRDDTQKQEAAENEEVWRKGYTKSDKIGARQNDGLKKGERQEISEQEKLEMAEEKIRRRLKAGDAKGLRRHIKFKMTDEGLRIDITDTGGAQMFASGSASPTPAMTKILSAVGSAVAELENKISITGHTDSEPFKGRRNYGNWELSSERAHAARRTLLQTGLDATRFKRIEGRADREPLIPDAPLDARNRRIGLVILRKHFVVPKGGVSRTEAGDDPLAAADSPANPASFGEKGASRAGLYVPDGRVY